MDIITREDAQAQGLMRFYTGKPCRNGHLSERLTRGTACLECERLRMRRNLTDPERNAKINFRRRKFYASNADLRARDSARKAERRSWVCTDGMDNADAIAEIYTERDHMSEFLGVPMHVDHIVPIKRGGAHHEDNLQIISATANCAKGARTDWEPVPNVYDQVTYRTTRGHKK